MQLLRPRSRANTLCAVLAWLGACGCKTGAPAWIADDMVVIPGGTFDMGSDAPGANADERPVHRVTVAAFRMDRTEVTVKAYRACVEAKACSEPDAFVPEKGNYRIFCNWNHPERRDLHPVNCIDYQQVRSFCAWAGKRLPSEEEWEYEARGGADGRKYPWGQDEPTCRHLNGCGSECSSHLAALRFPGGRALYPSSDGWPETSPVGSFPAGASKHGLLDMAGNVWEWTASPYASYDGTRAEAKRVLRGGSWGGWDAQSERASNRFRLDESSRAQFLGFRCAR